ncbi:MAG: tetratricopeptide repeat protein [Acidobacteria bacterium]|nr:tetratricopeptide repeat protein [Acidobacteriota bacterium]
MKLRVVILIIVLSGFTTGNAASIAGPAEEEYLRGVEYYTNGDYSQALETWLDIYNFGYRSAELNYNIGNAYFKLNNIPGALLFYERARLLKPGDEDINYNLAIAKTQTIDRFEEIPKLFFTRWFDFISLVNPANRWAGISIVSFILSLLALSIYMYSAAYKLKVTGFWTAILLMTMSISSFAFSHRNKTLVHNSNKAIIFDPSVNGKSSPDNSGTDLFLIHEGTKVTIVDAVGEWYEIRLSDGNKGWVPEESLEII